MLFGPSLFDDTLWNIDEYHTLFTVTISNCGPRARCGSHCHKVLYVGLFTCNLHLVSAGYTCLTILSSKAGGFYLPFLRNISTFSARVFLGYVPKWDYLSCKPLKGISKIQRLEAEKGHFLQYYISGHQKHNSYLA